MGGATVQEAVLDNGLSLVELPLAGRLATAVSIVFPAGARHESEEEVGAAHMLEHLVFKGTRGHPSPIELNRAAEFLGTDIDGATTTDYVEFSVVVRAELAMAATELLCEVVATPLLPEAGVAVERAVILQEIADANENPESRADELLSASLFAGHRLSTSVTGEVAHVESLNRERLISFRDRQWSTAAGLVAIAGNLDHLDRDRLGGMLGAIPERRAPPPPAQLPPFVPRVNCEERDSDVVHLRLAFHVPGFDFKLPGDRAVSDVFSHLLGGPMGSRLVDDLRERHALCYWVDSYVWGYERATYLSISCGVSPSNLDQAYQRIRAILESLRATGPTEEEHRRFCAYTAGVETLAFDSVGARLDHAVELIMEYGDRAIDHRHHLREIESVTRLRLAELASAIEPDPCVGCVGPVTEADFA